MLTPAQDGLRIDQVLVAVVPALGRAEARRLCAEGQVRLDGRRVDKGARGRAGAVLSLAAPPVAAAQPDANAPLVIAYADDFLVVVDKPAGQASHPLRPGEPGTVASALLARYPEMAHIGYGPLEAGLLHRLDIGTSGLLLAARDAETFQRLRALLVGEGLHKHYLAVCVGTVAVGVLSHRLEAQGRRVRVHPAEGGTGRPVRLEVLASTPFGGYSLVEVAVAHAARHQIRAQLAAAGHPLVDDPLYGGPVLLEGAHHCLHASRLAFVHPHTGQLIEVQSPLPPDRLAVVRALAGG